MIYLTETTGPGFPSHTYIMENNKSSKIIGYIQENTDIPIWFSKPLSFDKRKRKFTITEK